MSEGRGGDEAVLDRHNVISPDLGGGFGNKVPIYPGYVCAIVGALELGRPVKWIETRTENLTSTGFARDYHMDVEIGATADGRVTTVRPVGGKPPAAVADRYTPRPVNVSRVGGNLHPSPPGSGHVGIDGDTVGACDNLCVPSAPQLLTSDDPDQTRRRPTNPPPGYVRHRPQPTRRDRRC